jgi:hypothetical protein
MDTFHYVCLDVSSNSNTAWMICDKHHKNVNTPNHIFAYLHSQCSDKGKKDSVINYYWKKKNNEFKSKA